MKRKAARLQSWGAVGLVLTALAARAGREDAAGAPPDETSKPLRLLSAQTRLATTESPARRSVRGDYGKLPLSFEPLPSGKVGAFRFVSRGSGYGLFLAPTEAAVVLQAHRSRGEQVSAQRAASSTAERGEEDETPGRLAAFVDNRSPSAEGRSLTAKRKAATLRMRLVGANAEARLSGRGELPGRVNYLKGNDPAKWRANVPTFRAVAVEEVYPGIDLVYYGSQQQLEFDFVVAPGAEPAQIELAFAGAEKLAVDAQGDLVLHVVGGELRQHKPVVYQLIDGERKEIAGRFVLDQSAPADAAAPEPRVRFALADYDRNEPLVIDPVLSYSTFLGGTESDRAWDVAVDGEGDAYVTGLTLATDFLLTNAFQTNFAGGRIDGDIFVLKLNSAGTALAYATYLGGNGDDAGFGIAVDSAGNAYVTGLTTSTDFPTANALQPQIAGTVSQGLPVHPFDAVVTKLNAAGSALVYSTYLGGAGDDEGIGLAVDGAGSAYVTGRTTSTDFPTVNALASTNAAGFDAFVTKFGPEGTNLVYSTYLGGEANDYGEGVAVDAAGAAVVTGITASTNFPTANALATKYQGGVFDAFVTKLGPTGMNLVYSTYLGGEADDQGLRLALDAAGHAYVTGQTTSTNFLQTPNPLPGLTAQSTNAGSFDAFITKLDADGKALYRTYWGGRLNEEAWDIAVNPAGHAFVTGRSASGDFPVTTNALQGTNAGSFDVFVLHLPPEGAPMQLATLLGGVAQDNGFGIDVDPAGNICVTGGTASPDFPVLMPLRPLSTNGLADLFVLRLAPDPQLNAERVGNSLVLSWPRSLPGFVLESSASLGAADGWTPVGGEPVANGLFYTLTVEADEGNRSFRLRRE